EKLRTLDFCKKDGEEIYSILKNLGYQISSDNTLIGGQVKYEILRKSLIKFFTNSDIRSKDTLLFYFSGHGIPDGEGDTYIAVSDTDPDKPYENGISFEDLTKWMNKSISKRVVMILDCCCSGAAKITKGGEDEAAYLTRSAIDEKSKKLRQGEGKYLLAASLAAQAAYNMKKEDHSLFTYYLIDGLKGANGETVDKDGYVTPETLGSYVYDKVTSSLPKQKPVIKVEASGKIILASYPELSKSSINTFNLIVQAVSYLSQYNYFKAIEVFDQVIKLDPKNSQAWSMKGDSFLNLNEFENAIKCYDRCIELDPNNDAARRNKNAAIERRTRFNQKDKTDKEDYATNNATFDKIQKYIEKGKEYREIGSYTEAIHLLDEILKLDSHNFTACRIKAEILSDDLGEYEEAIPYFERILDKSPSAVKVLKGMAFSLEKLSRYEEAIECYDKVLEKHPNDEDSKKNRDIALEKHKEQKFSLIIKEIKNEFEKNEYSKVIDLCDTAIDIQPKDIIPYLYKGLSLGNLKRND
ncbi:MAG TPA: tetratricopeptide repeat protein, partial [Nitrososphaeraceae archaeon]|nr:tetratricopeptide repeat protein [Nitrososphaeraceae archaeon]